MICRICRQERYFRAIQRTARQAQLYGVVPYGLCLCGMEVLPELNDRNYKRRWRGAFRRAYFASATRGKQ